MTMFSVVLLGGGGRDRLGVGESLVVHYWDSGTWQVHTFNSMQRLEARAEAHRATWMSLEAIRHSAE